MEIRLIMTSGSPNIRQPAHDSSEYRQLNWQEIHSSRKTRLPPRDPSEYPQLNWTENDFALTYRLLDIFHQNEGIRRAIWPGPEDEPTGKIKTDVHNEIARNLLTPLNNKHSDCIQRKEGLRFYGKSVKNRLFKLRESYNKALERLGAAGAAFPNEETLCAEGENAIREAWESVRKTAPFFFRLKSVISQHPNIPMKSKVIRPRRHSSSGIRRPRRNVEGVDDEGDQSVHSDHESTGEDETRSEIPRVEVNGVASSAASETSLSEAAPTAVGSIFAHARGELRKRGASLKSDTTMIGWSGSLREMAEDSDKRRRICEREAEVTRRHQSSQETRRLRLAANMEVRRLEIMTAKEEKLEIRRMELANAKEQREHELEMKRLELLSQGIDVDHILRGKEIAGSEVVTPETGDDPTRTDWAGEVGPQLMRLTGENGLT